MKLYGIVAFCRNRGIGNALEIPWNISEDLKHFKRITMSNVVVMGYNTYMSIKSMPLPHRDNIVITSKTHLHYSSDRNIVFLPIEKLDKYLGINHSNDTVFICGGQQLYTHLLHKMTKLYITFVDKLYECDTFFPNFSESFELIDSKKAFDPNEGCEYWFLEYVSIKNEHKDNMQ